MSYGIIGPYCAGGEPHLKKGKWPTCITAVVSHVQRGSELLATPFFAKSAFLGIVFAAISETPKKQSLKQTEQRFRFGALENNGGVI